MEELGKVLYDAWRNARGLESSEWVQLPWGELTREERAAWSDIAGVVRAHIEGELAFHLGVALAPMMVPDFSTRKDLIVYGGGL